MIQFNNTSGFKEFVFDGIPRVLGKLRPRAYGSPFPRWKDKMPVLDRKDWHPVNRRDKFKWALDQLQHNSCVGNGAAGSLRTARVLAGMKDVALSPGYAYSLVNGNQDQGAVISDVCQKLIEVGTCTYDTVGQDPIYQRNMPTKAKQESPRFKILRALHARTFDEIVSGIMMDWIPVFGIEVADNFMQFDKDGVAGWSQGPGNHCMFADGFDFLPNGRPVIDDKNSWGMKFGPWSNGRCYLVEEHFAYLDPDAYLIQAAKTDPVEDADLPAAAA